MPNRYIEEMGDRDGGENTRLSAEEIAEMLANAYSGGGTAYEEKADESGRNIRRQQRMLEMRRKKRQQELMRRFMLPCAAILVICVIFAGLGIRKLVRRHQKDQSLKQSETIDDGSGFVQGDSLPDNSGKTDSDKKISYNSSLNVAGIYIDNTFADRINDEIVQIGTVFVRTLGGKSKEPPLNATANEATTLPASEVVSANSIFIDVEAERILEQMGADVRISPASMTKILTILVAAEHITNPDDKFEITQDIADYSYVHECSNAGFEVGERVTVRDLFYGTALPSGADAALGLAKYVSGSQEAFVELMNEKIEALGLSKTSHFTNCIGLYDENHYSTVYDIAVMLKAACDNSFCREVLNTRIYTTSVTEQHLEGITLSNLFLRRIEDKDTHGEILCAKTGYVVQSENCAASLGVDNYGKEYICVTAHSSSSWRCIYDHVALYQQLLPE